MKPLPPDKLLLELETNYESREVCFICRRGLLQSTPRSPLRSDACEKEGCYFSSLATTITSSFAGSGGRRYRASSSRVGSLKESGGVKIRCVIMKGAVGPRSLIFLDGGGWEGGQGERSGQRNGSFCSNKTTDVMSFVRRRKKYQTSRSIPIKQMKRQLK